MAHGVSDASLRLLLEFQDVDIDSILTIMTEQEVDGIISYNNGCVPGNFLLIICKQVKLSLIQKFTVGTFEDKAEQLNELVTLRGAAVGEQDDKFALDNFILQQMQVPMCQTALQQCCQHYFDAAMRGGSEWYRHATDWQRM